MVKSHKEKVTFWTVTDTLNYLNARSQADDEARKDNLKVVGMPGLITAFQTWADLREAVRPNWVTVNSAEYNLRNNRRQRVYVVAHEEGPLSTTEGLRDHSKDVRTYGFMPIEDHGFVKDAIDFRDARRGDVPSAISPYSIKVPLPKDYLVIPTDTDIASVRKLHKQGKPVIFESGQLTEPQFRLDDRVLSVCGSPELVDTLAHQMYDSREESGEGWYSLGSYHRIQEADLNNSGRPLFLNFINDGLVGDNIYYIGRFVLVAPEAHPRATPSVTLGSVIANAGLQDEVAPVTLQRLTDALTKGGYSIRK